MPIVASTVLAMTAVTAALLISFLSIAPWVRPRVR